MSTFWENFAAFWRDYGPYIGLTVIPALITGLSMSPKTKPAVTWVEKIWNGIKMVMDFLSVVTHKDNPGTFQLPLKAGVVVDKVKEKVEEAKEEKKDPGAGPGAALVFVMVLGASQSGCAWWSSNKGEVKHVAYDCSMSAMRDTAGPLLNTMVGILTGATDSTWRKQTGALMKEFGKDTVACATRYAMQKITNPVQSEPDPEMLKATATARSRALEVEMGWTYTDN